MVKREVKSEKITGLIHSINKTNITNRDIKLNQWLRKGDRRVRGSNLQAAEISSQTIKLTLIQNKTKSNKAICWTTDTNSLLQSKTKNNVICWTWTTIRSNARQLLNSAMLNNHNVTPHSL